MAHNHPLLRIDYPEFWPFFARSESGEVKGFFHDIVTQALHRMDVDVRWESYPWGRCQERVRKGEADAMVTFPSDERLQYAVTHKDPFYNKDLVVFTYAGHPRLEQIEAIQDLDDIKANNLTVITYVTNGWNNEHIVSRGIRTYETPLIKNIWLMLAMRRGDIVIEWPGAAWPGIENTGVVDKIVQTKVHLDSMPFHLMVRKNGPLADRMDEFNATIKEMRKDGTMDAILDQYLRHK